MHKILLLFIVFLSSFSSFFAQRYDFDYYINYEMTFSNSVRDMQNLYNSNNSGYRMKFNVINDNSVEALIIDSKVIHTFSLSNVNFPLKPTDFKYLHSKKIPGSEDARKFKVTDMKDLGNQQKEYSVSVPLNTCRIVVTPHEKDILYSGLALTFDGVPKNIPLDLFKDEKLMVMSSKCKFKDGDKNSIKLQSFQPMDLTMVILPAQLNFIQ